jgi:hypothetical protein
MVLPELVTFYAGLLVKTLSEIFDAGLTLVVAQVDARRVSCHVSSYLKTYPLVIDKNMR